MTVTTAIAVLGLVYWGGILVEISKIPDLFRELKATDDPMGQQTVEAMSLNWLLVLGVVVFLVFGWVLGWLHVFRQLWLIVTDVFRDLSWTLRCLPRYLRMVYHVEQEGGLGPGEGWSLGRIERSIAGPEDDDSPWIDPIPWLGFWERGAVNGLVCRECDVALEGDEGWRLDDQTLCCRCYEAAALDGLAPGSCIDKPWVSQRWLKRRMELGN